MVSLYLMSTGFGGLVVIALPDLVRPTLPGSVCGRSQQPCRVIGSVQSTIIIGWEKDPLKNTVVVV
jgi:hypothetical protein